MSSRPKTSHPIRLLLAHLCAFTLGLVSVSAQAVKPETETPDRAAEQARRSQPPRDSQIQRTSTTAGDDEIVEMSPFEVNVSARGYYADTTMAGTRINSSISDLASAITIVTTEQMDDFGMLDINDIFNYEVGTEGGRSFTDVDVDANGNVSDGNMDDPSSANRVRGIGKPNKTYGNFETSGRTPLDRLLLDGVEITRGPSSIIAGLGSPAGTANSIPAEAHLTKNKNKAQLRVNGDNGFRQSLDVSRVLIRNKLAIRAQQMFWHTGYQRKPSGTDAELYNIIVKYKPTKRTTFNISYSKYKISGNRANTLTPADGITPWRERGSYTWDPLMPNGNGFGAVYDKNNNMIATSNPNANYMSAHGLARMWQTSGRGTSLMFVDRDGSVLWMAPRGTAGDNALANDQAQYNYAMLLQRGVVDSSIPSALPRNVTPGVTDKSLYDWTSVNIAATDRFRQTNDTILARLTQTFIDTQKQYLAVDFGWFREDSNSYSKLLMGKSKKNQTSSFLAIDINRKLYDGSDNPNYLRPFLAVNQDLVADNPILNDTFRTQAAYKLDFRQDKGWTRWLGLHTVTAYHEYKQFETRRYNYRHAITSDHAWLPAGTPRGNSNDTYVADVSLPWNQVSDTSTRNYYFYYIGDPIGQNVDYSPGTLTPGNYDYIWGNVATGALINDPASLGLAADVAGSGGTSNSLKITKGMGAVIQSHLLNGGLVITAGIRRDKVFQKDGVAPQLNRDGVSFDFDWNNRWVDKWRENSGNTHAQGVVIKPAAWIKPTAPAWLRPLRQFSFFYNQSGSLDLNYDPAINLRGEDIDNPTGKGKDYGFTVRLFDDRLIMKLNRYENRTKNQRGTAAPVSRLLTLDIYEADYEDEELPDTLTANRTFGLNKVASDWVKQQALMNGETLSSAEIFNRVADIMQMTPERLRALQVYRSRVTEVDEGEASGYELELNWIPTNYLTLRFNASKAEAKNTTVAQGFTELLNERLDFWQNLIDPITGARWWTSAYPNAIGEPGQTAEAWYKNSIAPDWELAKAREGVANPNISEYRVKFLANLRLSGLTKHRILRGVDVSAAVTWASKTGIGNYGLDLDGPDADGSIVHTKYDPNRTVWGDAVTTVDLTIGYRTKILKTNARFQFSIEDVFQDGELRAVRADSNGKPYVFRIVDPRLFTFIATFEF